VQDVGAFREAPIGAAANRAPPTSVDVIVPTWNEEIWLPRLLGRLACCPPIDQIIVADNASTDGTLAVAHSFRCRVISGGLPAHSRNRGASLARASVLLFVDADSVLPLNLIPRTLDLFRDPKIVGIHYRVVPLTRCIIIRGMYRTMHSYVRRLNQVGIYQGIGTAIAVRREAFAELKGFREDIFVGEDADFLRRLGRLGKVVYAADLHAYTSPRRILKEGPVLFSAKVLLWSVLRCLKLNVSVIGYNWKKYTATDLFATEELILSEIERRTLPR
jgi:glycosyltransferase involved in cell wall biosynthesis